MHQILRGLHSKTGELTTEVNNLHSAVNLKGGSAGTGTGDGPSKSEVNRLINLQNEVHSAIRDLQYVCLFFIFLFFLFYFHSGVCMCMYILKQNPQYSFPSSQSLYKIINLFPNQRE